MDLSNDPIGLETEKVMSGINNNLHEAAQLNGTAYNRVFAAVYELVKENMAHKEREQCIKVEKEKFPLLNNPDYYCAKATVHGNGSTWSVNILKNESFDFIYQRALQYFKEFIKDNYKIKEITLYKSEGERWLEATPLAVFPVTEN